MSERDMKIMAKEGFQPHWNHALDKKPVWIATRNQMDKELGKRGLTLISREEMNRPNSPHQKKLEASRETRELTNAIKAQTKNGTFQPSGALTERLIKKGVIQKRSDLERMKQKLPKDHSKGGMYEG